jgi:hypothetical protein
LLGLRRCRELCQSDVPSGQMVSQVPLQGPPKACTPTFRLSY